MNDIERLKFLQYVSDTLASNPEILGDLTYAMQKGIAVALMRERRHAGDLAGGFATMFQCDKRKTIVTKWRSQLQSGLRALADHYRGAAIEREIMEYIDD